MTRSTFLLGSLLALPAAAAEKAAAPAPGPAGGMFQVFFGLAVVLAVMAGAAWLLKRMGGARAGGAQAAKLVGGVNVGTRERVMVVEVADQWIVVGVAPGQVSALATMPRQEIAAPPEAGRKPDFAAWLKQTLDQRKAR